MNLKISVIICAYNRAGFLPKALNSVLAQSFKDWEIIIIDDASADNTAEIVRPYLSNQNIKYYKNEKNLGISKSRNMGVSLAKGEYIAMLDSDDYWIDKEKLKKQLDFLKNNPDYILIGSNIKIIDEKNNFIKNTDFETKDNDIREKILRFNQFAQSTVMYRKESAEKVGEYNEKLSCVEDLDLFLKLGLLGKMKNLKEITTAYTRHSGGISYKRKLAMAWNNYKIVLKNFGKYPNWFIGIIFAKLRILKNLF